MVIPSEPAGLNIARGRYFTTPLLQGTDKTKAGSCEGSGFFVQMFLAD